MSQECYLYSGLLTRVDIVKGKVFVETEGVGKVVEDLRVVLEDYEELRHSFDCGRRSANCCVSRR